MSAGNDRSRRSGGRPAGPVRLALREVIGAGLSGSADVLARHTGWPPESVRAVLREMRREGEAANFLPDAGVGEHPRARGRPPKVFAASSVSDFGPAQALAFVHQVWR